MNTRNIQKLIELLEEYKTIHEIEYKRNFFWILPAFSIRLFRNSSPITQPTIIQPDLEQRVEEQGPNHEHYEINSPYVGTIYTKNPQTNRPYIRLKDKIKHGQIVARINVVGDVYQEIRSNVEGRIKRILARDGHPVGYGQKLFEVIKHRIRH